MGSERFVKMSKAKGSVTENRPDMWGEQSDPDIIHCPDKYDNDFIWDGETMDDEKS